MRVPVIVILATAAAGCSGGQDNTAPTANFAAPAVNQIAALSDGQRNAVFIRALRDAGLDCQHVERSVPADPVGTMPVWRATCQGGADYMIAIGPDGTAQILPSGNPLGSDATANGSGED